jgi:hypothetical protein
MQVPAYYSGGNMRNGSALTPTTDYSLSDGIAAFHWEQAANGSVNSLSYFSLWGGGVEICRVKVLADRSIEVWTGDTLTLRSVSALSLPVAASYIAIRFKTGASGRVDVAIDGTSVTTGTINVGTTASWDQIQWYTSDKYAWWWMPTVWDDPATDTALTATKWLTRIAPSADAAAGGWTGSNGGTITADIDEIQHSAADYASTTTDPDEFRCDVSSTASINANWTPGAIHGVVCHSVMKGEGGLTASQNAVKSGSTTAYSAAVSNTTTSQIRTSVQTTDPATSAAWANKAAIDAAEFGVKAS